MKKTNIEEHFVYEMPDDDLRMKYVRVMVKIECLEREIEDLKEEFSF